MQWNWFCKSLLVAYFWFNYGVAFGQVSDVMLAATAEPQTISFRDALKLGLEQNSSLKKVEQGIVIAHSDTFSTASRLMPQLTARASQPLLHRVGGANADDNARAGFSLVAPLLDAKSLVEVQQKREAAKVAEDKFRHEQDVLINTIGNLYIEALIASSMRDTASEEREQYTKQLSTLRNKAKLGTARKLDVIRAEYLANKAHSDYLLKHQEFLKRMGELGQKIAVRDFFHLSGVELESPHFSESVEQLHALANNANDMIMAQRDIRQANFSLVSEKFDFMPKLNATLDYSWQTPHERTLVGSAWTSSTRIMLNIELPLFTGWSTFSAMRSKTATRMINELTLRAKSTEKFLTVNSLLTEIADLGVVKSSVMLALDAAQKAKESADRLFIHGDATGLEVTEANTNLYAAKNQLHTTTLRLEQAKLKLLFTIGKVREIL